MAEPIIRKENIEDLPIAKVTGLQGAINKVDNLPADQGAINLDIETRVALNDAKISGGVPADGSITEIKLSPAVASKLNSLSITEITATAYDALTQPEKDALGLYIIVPLSGYSTTFNQADVNAGNQTAIGFTFAGGTTGATYNYSIASSGGGTPVAGTGTLTSATQAITGLDVTGLTNGTLTNSVYLSDAGGTGATVTSTVVKNVVVATDLFPTGNAASVGAGEANDIGGWIRTSVSVMTISSVVNTDVQGGSYAIQGTATGTSYRYIQIETGALPLVPHTATIRARRVVGTGSVTGWVGATSLTYDVPFDSVTNGEWVTGTVVFTPTGAGVVTVRIAVNDNDGSNDGTMEVNSIIITEN